MLLLLVTCQVTDQTLYWAFNLRIILFLSEPLFQFNSRLCTSQLYTSCLLYIYTIVSHPLRILRSSVYNLYFRIYPSTFRFGPMGHDQSIISIFRTFVLCYFCYFCYFSYFCNFTTLLLLPPLLLYYFCYLCIV